MYIQNDIRGSKQTSEVLTIWYNYIMKKKTLTIAVIKKDNSILMRKKPAGSLPYKETWYLFGAESDIKGWVKEQTGIEILVGEEFDQDSEVKADHDGVVKQFIYIDVMCEYVGGELTPGEGIETLKWIPISELKNYDIVPPSVKLFKKLGYL